MESKSLITLTLQIFSKLRSEVILSDIKWYINEIKLFGGKKYMSKYIQSKSGKKDMSNMNRTIKEKQKALGIKVLEYNKDS